MPQRALHTLSHGGGRDLLHSPEDPRARSRSRSRSREHDQDAQDGGLPPSDRSTRGHLFSSRGREVSQSPRLWGLPPRRRSLSESSRRFLSFPDVTRADFDGKIGSSAPNSKKAKKGHKVKDLDRNKKTKKYRKENNEGDGEGFRERGRKEKLARDRDKKMSREKEKHRGRGQRGVTEWGVSGGDRRELDRDRYRGVGGERRRRVFEYNTAGWPPDAIRQHPLGWAPPPFLKVRLRSRNVRAEGGRGMYWHREGQGVRQREENKRGLKYIPLGGRGTQHWRSEREGTLWFPQETGRDRDRDGAMSTTDAGMFDRDGDLLECPTRYVTEAEGDSSFSKWVLSGRRGVEGERQEESREDMSSDRLTEHGRKEEGDEEEGRQKALRPELLRPIIQTDPFTSMQYWDPSLPASWYFAWKGMWEAKRLEDQKRKQERERQRGWRVQSRKERVTRRAQAADKAEAKKKGKTNQQKEAEGMSVYTTEPPWDPCMGVSIYTKRRNAGDVFIVSSDQALHLERGLTSALNIQSKFTLSSLPSAKLHSAKLRWQWRSAEGKMRQESRYACITRSMGTREDVKGRVALDMLLESGLVEVVIPGQQERAFRVVKFVEKMDLPNAYGRGLELLRDSSCCVGVVRLFLLPLLRPAGICPSWGNAMQVRCLPFLGLSRECDASEMFALLGSLPGM